MNLTELRVCVCVCVRDVRELRCCCKTSAGNLAGNCALFFILEHAFHAVSSTTDKTVRFEVGHNVGEFWLEFHVLISGRKLGNMV